TNPPATNDAVEKGGKTYTRMVDKMPDAAVLAEIDAKVDQKKMEETLMSEGTAKFSDPQHALLKLIAQKRGTLTPKYRYKYLYSPHIKHSPIFLLLIESILKTP